MCTNTSNKENHMTHIRKFIQNILEVLFMPIKMNQYNTTYTQLDKLSDRDLWDMGITRGDIHDIASGKYKKNDTHL
jgi:uncharacterized protein YjiS (DUF1127 family)